MPRQPQSSISSATIWCPPLALLDHVAAAEEQQRRLARDLTGTDDGGACGAFVLAGEGIRHDELAELFDEAVVAAEVVIALGRGGLEADFDDLAPLGLTTGRRSTSWGGRLPGTMPKPSRSL